MIREMDKKHEQSIGIVGMVLLAFVILY